MTLEHLSVVAMVGSVAGYLASRLAGGHGYGVVSDLLVGVIGALFCAVVLGVYINDHMMAPLATAARSLVAQSIVAFIGASMSLTTLRAFAGSGLVGRRREGRRLYERRVYERRFRWAVSWSTRVTDGRRLPRPRLFGPLVAECMPPMSAAASVPVPNLGAPASSQPLPTPGGGP